MFIKKAIAVLAAFSGIAITANAALSSAYSVFSQSGNVYRIPAVTALPSGNLIAICDDRGTSVSDLGSTTVKLISKISTDNGKTWSSDSYAVGNFDSTTPSHGDAAIALDKFSGKVVCLFAAEQDYTTATEANPGKIYMTTSSDGKNWDTAYDITDQIKKQVTAAGYTYKAGFVASGNMLYKSGNHQGTIYAVVTVKAYVNTGYFYADRQLAFVIKSTDTDRKEWTVLNPTAYGNPVYNDGNESKLVHFKDDDGNEILLMSMRTAGAQRYFTSTDDGKTWSKYSTGMTQPGCNGDIITVSYNAKSYLLQSLPNDASDRKNVSIYYSDDNGKTWNFGKQIVDGNSAYSSLVRLWNGSIGCLVEEGDDTNGYKINFYTLEMTDILPESLISNEYDGTLVCNGKGYLSVPSDNAFSVSKGGTKTITCRMLLNDFTNTDDKDFGVLSNRWHANNTNKYKCLSGYEIIAGKNEDESLGANVSIDSETSGNRHVLKNTYFDAVLPSRWAHVALVIDFENGNAKIYVDGALKETMDADVIVSGDDTTETGASVKGASITTNGTYAYQNVSRDLLIGNRYSLGSEYQKYVALFNSYTTYFYAPVSTDRIFNSNIDDVRIYEEALSADDVLNDKNSGFPIRTKESGLLAAYDFANQDGEFSNSTFNDISGNSHNGTICTVDDYTFPTISSNITVTPVTPDEEEGSLFVTRFNYGDEIYLTNGQAYAGTINQDYKATAVANEGWVLIGIYVNGVAVPNNGFFKAGENAIVEAKFRKAADIDFYLVGDLLGKNAESSNKFTYDESNQNYTFTYNGKFNGKFYVIGVDKDSNETILLNLFADYTPNEYGICTVTSNTAYNLVNTTDGVPFSVYPDGCTDDIHYYLNPTLTLVYNDTQKTIAITNYTTTEVEDIAVDTNNAPVEYYNLQGIRINIENAQPGVYIRRQGNNATKVCK